MKSHLKHMLIGGSAIFAVLLVLGVNVGSAVQWAILLACPLMMIGMMWMMGRGQGHGAAQDRSDNQVRDRDGAAQHQHH